MTGRVNSKIKPKRNVKTSPDSSDKNSNDESDTSVVGKPFTTSISGLTNIIKVFNTSTEEVRNYLTYECEILCECRVCRNIFRSLSNFIMHKRTYCQEKYNCIIHVKCANSRETDYLNVTENKESEQKTEENEKHNKLNKKSLHSLVETLAQKKQFGFERADFSMSDFYKNSGQPELKESTPEMQLNLEHIKGSKSGVFQTFSKNEEDCENKLEEMQLEVTEIHNMLQGQSVVLGSDGKILNLNKGNIGNSYSAKLNRTCEECDITFSTRKTYASHVKYKHANSRLVYPCPECSEVYASSWSVFRHLFNIHRKTLAQVKKLREQIQAKAFYQLQSPIKKKVQTLKADINEQQKIDDENQEWMDNFETDNDMQMCGGCGKRFERRAALNSHSQTCQKRIAARNTIVINRSKRIAAAEDKTDKKQSKIPKFDSLVAPKGTDKRKPSILKKRKIGIQIRYDYTKPVEKIVTPSLSTIENEEKENNKSISENKEQSKFRIENDLKENQKSDNVLDADYQFSEMSNKIFCSEIVKNTEEIYSIIGVPSDKKNKDEEKPPTDSLDPLTDIVLDSEVLSVHSSNDTTPNKDDPLHLSDTQDDTDSEIEEILGCPPDSITKDLFHISDLSTNNSKADFENGDINNISTVNEDTLKLIKLIDPESSSFKNTLSIDDRMADYTDIKHLQCKPCNIKFVTLSKLRCHMALHFNWLHYCCDICALRAYEKSTIYEHVLKDHNIVQSDKIEAVILQMSERETIEMASNELIELNEVNLNPDKEMEIQEIESEENKSSTPDSCIFVKTEIIQAKNTKTRGRPPKRKTHSCTSIRQKGESSTDEDVKFIEENVNNKDKRCNEAKAIKDVALRKMVFEVIFGQNSESSVDNNILSKSDSISPKKNTACSPEETIETSNISTRPIRNRVKPVDKDFIYDINEFTDVPRSISQSSNRAFGHQEKHVTGSFEDISDGKRYSHKKTGKKPGPKCKTQSNVNVNDNIINLPLQNYGKQWSDIEDCIEVPEEDTKKFFTDISVLESSNSKNVKKFTHIINDGDVWIIEDD